MSDVILFRKGRKALCSVRQGQKGWLLCSDKHGNVPWSFHDTKADAVEAAQDFIHNNFPREYQNYVIDLGAIFLPDPMPEPTE